MTTPSPSTARLLRQRRPTGWCCVKALIVVLAGAAFWAVTVAVVMKP